MALTFMHVVRAPNGDAEIGRTGVRVYTILCLHQSGDTPEEIADDYGLPIGAVYEALAHAADHPEEMDAIRQADAAATRELWSALPEELVRGLDIPG